MPRQNRPRTVPFESHVATNVATARERAGLTYERLAARMTERGCPIQPSALHKMEKGDPPRRITVNELMVLADVLGVKAFDLVDDPDTSAPPDIWRIVLEVEELQRTIEQAEGAIAQAVDRMVGVIGGDAGLRRVLRRYLEEGWSDWPAVRDRFRPALRPGKKAAR